jgi:transcription antitermination protein NusB
MTVKHFRRYAREWAMQFLFQNDLAIIENKEKALDFFLSQMNDTEVFDVPSEAKLLRKAARTVRIIVDGILENITEIDLIISEYSAKWTITRMNTVDRNILRVAVYEMLYCPNVPPVVSINEAVEIGKIYGTDNTASFINGVLNAVMSTLNRPPREAVKEK